MSARLTDLLPPMSDAFSFQALRRFPDLEADNLVAVDATDRLVLAEATEPSMPQPRARSLWSETDTAP